MSSIEEGVNNSGSSPEDSGSTHGTPPAKEASTDAAMESAPAQGQGPLPPEASPHEVLHQLMDAGQVAPPAVMHWMIHAHRHSQLMYVMARLDLADKLVGGPRSAADLATELGFAEEVLTRLLRGLAWSGALRLAGADWELTSLGRSLCSSPDPALRDAALHAGALLYPAWGALMQGLEQGQVPFEAAFGRTFFEEMTADPVVGERFDRVMNEIARGTADALVASGVLADARLIVDVGGGNGVLLRRILAGIPKARGIVFDQPRLEPVARETLAHPECGGRGQFVAGDFFQSVAPGGDVYILQRILHDWGDAHCERILVQVAAALAPGGMVLVVEELLAEGPPGPADHAIAIDLAMLVVTGGRERSEAAYKKIAARAGLSHRSSSETDHGLWTLRFSP